MLHDVLLCVFYWQARATVRMPRFDKSARDHFMLALRKYNLTDLLHWTLSNRNFSMNSCNLSVVCFLAVTAIYRYMLWMHVILTCCQI